jgi:hypothetical protein
MKWTMVKSLWIAEVLLASFGLLAAIVTVLSGYSDYSLYTGLGLFVLTNVPILFAVLDRSRRSFSGRQTVRPVIQQSLGTVFAQVVQSFASNKEDIHPLMEPDLCYTVVFNNGEVYQYPRSELYEDLRVAWDLNTNIKDRKTTIKSVISARFWDKRFKDVKRRKALAHLLKEAGAIRQTGQNYIMTETPWNTVMMLDSICPPTTLSLSLGRTV